jgi:hypothetical protein
MAAGNTYTPVQTTTLGSAQSSVTLSSIPSTYTDIIFVVNFGVGSTNFSVKVNSDNGSNYSYTRLFGTGTTVYAQDDNNNSTGVTSNWTNTGPSIMSVYCQNYANTSVYKSILTRFSEPQGATAIVAGLWRSTSAINSLTLYSTSSQTIPAGTILTIYGIAAA